MSSTPPITDLGPLEGYKPPPNRKLSEDEFLAWCDPEVKAEWVDGKVIVVPPATLVHCELTTFLVCTLGIFAEREDLGEVLGWRLMVRLNPRCRRVPDVVFISKEHLQNIGPTHLEGPPDLAIEVVSSESVARDWREKYYDYQAAGVREYWIIDPVHQRVAAYNLVDTEYQPIAIEQGRIGSSVVPGFFLREDWLWRAKLPKIDDALKEIAGEWRH
jgi:Uma2 family endonuclease